MDLWESCSLAFPCSVNGLSMTEQQVIHIPTVLVFWPLVSLFQNSMVLAVYLLFSVACFFTVHEHLHKVHNLIKIGNPFHKKKLPLNHLFQNLFYTGNCHFKALSKMVQQWVVNTSLSRTIIDFMGFSGILQDTAVANKKYFYHFSITP